MPQEVHVNVQQRALEMGGAELRSRSGIATVLGDSGSAPPMESATRGRDSEPRARKAGSNETVTPAPNNRALGLEVP